MSRRARDIAQRLVAPLDDDVRRDLAEEPLVALELMGYTVRLRTEAEVPGACSVAGSSDPGPPPTITVVQTLSHGRQNFTGLHELGHLLVQTDDDIHDLFAREPDDGRKLEEDVCDAVAAELLLPQDAVDRYIGDNGPTARSVVNLFHNHQASREACCVRAAQRLVGAGHVMLIKDGVAQFTASANTPYRVRRQTPQPDDHPITQAAKHGAARGEAPVRYASGGLSDRFFVDASADGDYVFAVFADSHPAWINGLALMATATKDEWGNIDTKEIVETYCPHCDMDFDAVGSPCPTCEAPFHWGRNGCRLCSCDTDFSAAAPPPSTKQACSECFLPRPITEFAAGTDVCDYCLGG